MVLLLGITPMLTCSACSLDISFIQCVEMPFFSPHTLGSRIKFVFQGNGAPAKLCRCQGQTSTRGLRWRHRSQKVGGLPCSRVRWRSDAVRSVSKIGWEDQVPDDRTLLFRKTLSHHKLTKHISMTLIFFYTSCLGGRMWSDLVQLFTVGETEQCGW